MTVEWTRLAGEQAESLVAMLINREHPNSLRITPSKGDGGVDILDRRAGPTGGDVVYQVKRHCAPLTSKQKKDVVNSLEALVKDERWSDLRVEEWHLALPWDPTPEAEHWLQDIDAFGTTFTRFWKGATYLDSLAAKYADVVDYHHGGRDRVLQAWAESQELLDSPAIGMDAKELGERLDRAMRVLSHDPLYRYELGAGEGTPPPPPQEGTRPGLALHTLRASPGGRWTSINVIARCAAAAQIRPITIKGQFDVDANSEFAQQLRDFLDYGAGFVSPEGAFRGQVDAPGGLSDTLKSATVSVWPAGDVDVGDDPELRFEVLSAAKDGAEVLAEVPVDRVELTQGATGPGTRVVLRESNGLFELEIRYHPDKPPSGRWTFGDFVGVPVTSAAAALRFLSEVDPAHQLRVSQRFSDARHGSISPLTGHEWGQEMSEFLHAAASTVERLAFLQEHTATVLRTPDFAEVSRGQFASWRRAEVLLQGGEVTTTRPVGQENLLLELDPAVEVGELEDEELGVVQPIDVPVGDQTVNLGSCVATFSNVKILEQDRGEQATRVLFSCDREVKWSPGPAVAK